jgi:hypothetical protein
MSLDNIVSRAFNTTVNVIHPVKKKNDKGQFITDEDETGYSYEDLPATIRQEKSIINYESEGKIHTQTHRGYINAMLGGEKVEILPDDLIYDNTTEYTYTILNIEYLLASNASIQDYHHVKLGLQKND